MLVLVPSEQIVTELEIELYFHYRIFGTVGQALRASLFEDKLRSLWRAATRK